LAEALHLTAQEDEALAETQAGEADGMFWPDYVERFGAFDMVREPERPFAPGGESWLDFRSRVEGGLERLARDYQDETVIAVTHGGFVETALLVLFDIPRPGTGADLEAGNTSITEWRYSNGIWILVRFNDIGHLKD
jgi:probable phosphoglycerate mutase